MKDIYSMDVNGLKEEKRRCENLVREIKRLIRIKTKRENRTKDNALAS